MTYDHWKTTNPADEFLGDTMTEDNEDMSAFWFARIVSKKYAIGLGSITVAVVEAPDDYLASQWAHCMCAALNDRERRLRLAAEADRLEGED